MRFSLKAFAFSRFASIFACMILCGVFTAQAGNPIYVAKAINGGSDANTGTGPASPRLTITEAIADISSGDSIIVGAGNFQEQVNYTKRAVIKGSGRGVTLISVGAGGSAGAVQLSVTGLSNSRLVLSSLTVNATNMSHVSVGLANTNTGTNVAYLDMIDVDLVGNNNSGTTEAEKGLYVDPTSSLYYANFTNVSFKNCGYGLYFHKLVNSSDTSNVRYVNFTSCDFSHNDLKGVYAEKLSDATFTDCSFKNNGFTSVGVFSGFLSFMSGIDINVKAGNYKNIYFSHCYIDSNARGGAKEGTGITIKARDDAPSYSTYPATLDNVVVYFCHIGDNERGGAIGEPGKNNAGPTNVKFEHNNIVNNIKLYGGNDGSTYGGFVNRSMSTVNVNNNWWGTADSTIIPTLALAGPGSGAVSYSPYLKHATGDLTFNLDFVKIPGIRDDTMSIVLKIRGNSDSTAEMQFDVTVPRNSLIENSIMANFYTPGGAASNVLNVLKNQILPGTATTATYRLTLNRKNMVPVELIHPKIPNDTSYYSAMKLSFLVNHTAQMGDVMDFKIGNITATEKNGAPIRFTLKDTRIVREKTISFKLKPTGDVNGSGSVNLFDLSGILNHILQIKSLVGFELAEADLNIDTRINIVDATLMLNLINGIPITAVFGSDSRPLVIALLNGNNHFEIKEARMIYFTSTTPMTEVYGLEKYKVEYNSDKTAMSVTFDEVTDCQVSFGDNHTVVGHKVGFQSTNSVEEEVVSITNAYPNPSNGQVTIPGSGEINIFAIDGKPVYKGKIDGKLNYTNDVPGAYTFIITGSNGTSMGKFVITK